MGREYKALCNVCQEEFQVREGGGRDFYLLHCDVCGKEKMISVNEVMDNISKKPSDITMEEWIELKAGKCDCKEGHHRFKAKMRCPRCKSANYRMIQDDKGKVRIGYYD